MLPMTDLKEIARTGYEIALLAQGADPAEARRLADDAQALVGFAFARVGEGQARVDIAAELRSAALVTEMGDAWSKLLALAADAQEK